MNIKRFLGFGCMLGLFLGSSAKTIDVYVSQQVSGQGDGSKNNPFVSLQQVTEKLKELRASGNIDPVNVCIAPGLYELEAPLRMTSEQNSGNDGMVTFVGKRRRRIERRQAHYGLGGNRIEPLGGRITRSEKWKLVFPTIIFRA